MQRTGNFAEDVVRSTRVILLLFMLSGVSTAGTNETAANDQRNHAAQQPVRLDARQRPAPVVVRVQGRVRQAYVDAAQEAVALSGTEFVLEDKNLHRRVDITWTLESTHDGAVKLRSALDPSWTLPDEVFSISFVDPEHLRQRIAHLARSRMRRIRYIWRYEQRYPAVQRDFDFVPDPRVPVQRITWLDQERNEFEADMPFAARIHDTTRFGILQLTDEKRFPKNDDGWFDLDPLSNVTHRVVIARQPQTAWIWVAVSYGFVGLSALACVGLVVDLRRGKPSPDCTSDR